MLKRMSLCGLMLAALGWASPALAAFGITSTSGDVAIVGAPSDARENQYEDNAAARIWLEFSGDLPSVVGVDTATDGAYPGLPSVGPASSIAAGTNVNSYTLHADVFTGFTRLFDGSITFDGDILGVIVKSATFVASDFLSSALNSPGTQRMLDGGDTFSFFGNTLSFDVRTGGGLDQIRVLVAAVPEPATLGMWALVGLTATGVYWRRKR